MLYNPPTGGAANDPYVGKNVAAGTQGSKIPPAMPEFTQREIVNTIVASGQTPTNSDVQQLLRAVRSGTLEHYLDTGAVNAPAIAPSPAHTSLVDGLHVRVHMSFAPTGPAILAINSLGAPIQRRGGAALIGAEWAVDDIVDLVYNAKRGAFQIAGLTKSDVTQATYGATSKGGLALDTSSNFLLSLISNLNADGRNQPVAADILALGRAADGAMVGVSAAKLASYILSNIIATGTFQQIAINPVLYVRTDGNDNNSGLTNTSGGAFATIAAALAAGTSAYTFSGSALTIQLGIPGTYASPGRVPKGTGTITLRGDPANQGNYIVSGVGTSSSAVLYADNSCSMNIVGLTISNTGTLTHTLRANSQASVLVSNVTMQCTQAGGAAGAHFAAIGGSIEINTGCIAIGNMNALLLGGTAGLVSIDQNCTLTIQGNATYSTATALATNLGQIILQPTSAVVSTGTVTGSRYSVNQNANINTNGGGANAFPGSTAGTKDASAAYYV